MTLRSPALAIAWEFRQRHRWGLLAMAGYLLVLGAIKLLVLGPGQTVNLESWGFAAVVVVPLSVAFVYLLAAFCFGLEGDLAARQSIYPARMFTLPVTTAALAGWPMLYGMAAVATLWLVAVRFAFWPMGIDLPLIWPALLGAVFLGWAQALTWMPYGLPGLRVIAAGLWLAAVDTVILLGVNYELPERLMVAGLAPLVPFAYFVAVVAVARARRGDVPDWREMFARLAQVSNVLRRRKDHFPSPGRAQMWFEWQRHGWSLPALVGILLPFEMVLLWAGRIAPPIVTLTLVGMLLTPPFMASFAALTISKANPHGHDSHGVTPFIGTRPLSTALLIAAKLRMTIWTTLAAWLLVLVTIPLGLTLSGTWPVVIERARDVIEGFGTPRAIVIGLLGLSALMASTWKQLVQTLYIGLTGRQWVIRSSEFLALSFLVAIGPIAQWIHDDRGVQATLWDAIPLILAVLVCFKMSAAAWVATRLNRSRLLGDYALVTGAAVWLAAVLVVYGVLVWFFSTPLFPRYFLMLVAILAVPLVRLSVAPLALAWNRHR